MDRRGGPVPAFFALIVFVIATAAQQLPDRIRGYKVHRGEIAVNVDMGTPDAMVKVGEPELVDASISGVTLELPVELTPTRQSGKVDFVAFHDVRVNGVIVEPEEYAHKFAFRKGEKLTLSRPIRIFLPAAGVVRAAWSEMTASRKEWTVTGRAFVFGRFRKFGVYHKRVAVIDIKLNVKNPVLDR